MKWGNNCIGDIVAVSVSRLSVGSVAGSVAGSVDGLVDGLVAGLVDGSVIGVLVGVTISEAVGVATVGTDGEAGSMLICWNYVYLTYISWH